LIGFEIAQRGPRAPNPRRHSPDSGQAAAPTRSRRPVTPMACAQCSQQKKVPSFSRPCPTMRMPQFLQVGASAWIAHSIWVVPSMLHLKCLVVVVSTGFTSGHDNLAAPLGLGLEVITRPCRARFRPVLPPADGTFCPRSRRMPHFDG